jgi:transposase InsO family protein
VRYRELGPAGMVDRSSRPHHSPRRTPTQIERRIIKVRLACRWGPARIAYLLGLNPATVHRVLTRYRLPRLAQLDRATGQMIRRRVIRYEHRAPGDLIHVDIKKLGNIPGYLHNAVDDHSRLAYCEILPDEGKHSAVAFWHRAQAYFKAAGITVARVLTGNRSCYKSYLWRDTLTAAGITHKRTRPYRPRTNRKVERFNRTLLEEWAYTRPYQSEHERREAFPHWLHTYNHHRGHTALAGKPPASRVPNLSGQNS